jgi:hypothetical protein
MTRQIGKTAQMYDELVAYERDYPGDVQFLCHPADHRAVKAAITEAYARVGLVLDEKPSKLLETSLTVQRGVVIGYLRSAVR